MNYNEIMQLVKYLNKSDLVEFKIKDKDFELAIRTKHYLKSKIVQGGNLPVNMAMAPTTPSVEPVAAPVEVVESQVVKAPVDENAGLVTVKSPIVGTFYRSPSPDKPAYIKVGDTISEGSVVCIIEAMKLFNEIESEVSGKIVKVLVEDASPVEYDQALFLVDPKG